MNPRIETIAPGITRESISEHTHLIYDPATKGASVSFQYRQSIYVNDQYQCPAGDWNSLVVDVTAIAERCFAPEGTTDPITGADLNAISGAGIVTLIKLAFPALYDEAFTEASSI